MPIQRGLYNRVTKSRIGIGAGALLVILSGITLIVFHNSQSTPLGVNTNIHATGIVSLPSFHQKVLAAVVAIPTSPVIVKNIVNVPHIFAKTILPVIRAVPSGDLYTDSSSTTVIASINWMTGHGVNTGLQKINATPAAHWFGEWNTNIQTDVNNYVSAALAAGKIPLLVAYNIPNRDCGGQSAGGATNEGTYASWIRAFAAGISKRTALVILEPDSVAASCFDDSRAAILSSAISTLTAETSASIYLDSGNSNWLSASTMSTRLQKANITQATGFSLNVSNYLTTEANISFGTSVSQLIGGKHFVIDTSRNGNGPTSDSQWCNAPDRAVGQVPTLRTAQPLVDAYLWVKTPGESDGSCGPAQAGSNPPPAGTWWPEYALMLAKNANW